MREERECNVKINCRGEGRAQEGIASHENGRGS